MATTDSHSEWWTPRDLVTVLDQEFHFDLDAAATAQNRVCEHFISPEQDALQTPWVGSNIWCNPPYGKGHSFQIRDFVRRGCEQSLEQHSTVIMLLPAYTDPRYWRDYCAKAHEIRFLTGRLAFLEDGCKRMSARFPSALVIWRWFPGTCYKVAHQWIWDWRT